MSPWRRALGRRNLAVGLALLSRDETRVMAKGAHASFAHYTALLRRFDASSLAHRCVRAAGLHAAILAPALRKSPALSASGSASAAPSCFRPSKVGIFEGYILPLTVVLF